MDDFIPVQYCRNKTIALVVLLSKKSHIKYERNVGLNFKSDKGKFDSQNKEY